MRVLITGASGFVGRRLLPALLSDGIDAIGADRELDVTDAAALGRALHRNRPDAVIHLAAMSSVARSWQAPDACYRLNFLGTRNLLRQAETQIPEARLLLVGSADQYAATQPSDRPMDEATPLRPRSPYARSKAAGELLGRRAAARGLDVLCLRAFNHTGAGQPDLFVVSSFARQVAAIASGRSEARMRVGNLESVRDFLHVDDVVRAYSMLLDRDVAGGVYNIASERATPIQEVLDRLIARAGIEPSIERDPERWRPTDWLVGDSGRLRAATGWQPKISLDAILDELYAYWLEKDA